MDFANGVHIISFPEVKKHQRRRITLRISCTAGTGNTSTYNHTADEISAHQLEGDEYTFDWDVDERIMLSGSYTVKIFDEKGYIETAVLSPRFNVDDSRLIVERYENGAWVADYDGLIDANVHIEERVIEFSADPPFEKLDSWKMEGSGDTPHTLWVRSAGTGEEYYYSTKFFHANGQPYRIWLGVTSERVLLRDLISKIFGLFMTTPTAHIYSDWIFANASETVTGTFDQLYVSLRGAFMNAAGNTYDWAHASLKDVLKDLLMSIGMYSGMLSASSYFAGCVFDSGVFHSVDTAGKIIALEKSIEKAYRALSVKSGSYTWVSYTFDNAPLSDILEDDLMEIPTRGNIFYLGDGANYHQVSRVRRPGGNFMLLAEMLGNAYANFYLTRAAAQRYSFTLSGVNYEPSTTFIVEGRNCVPVEMTRDYDANTTRVKAITVGSTSQTASISSNAAPAAIYAGIIEFISTGESNFDATVPMKTGAIVYMNGVRQRLTSDYTLDGTQVKFTEATPSGSVIVVDMRFAGSDTDIVNLTAE